MDAKYFFDNYKQICNDYKRLSVYDKLSFIHFDKIAVPGHRNEIAVYLNALRKNNTDFYKRFESFGKTPREMAYNKIIHDNFTPCKFVLSKHGYIEITEKQFELQL